MRQLAICWLTTSLLLLMTPVYAFNFPGSRDMPALDQPLFDPEDPAISKFLSTIPAFEPVNKSKEEWQSELLPEAYHVMWEHGTEPPFKGEYDGFYQEGIYYCASCDHPLFNSSTKFDSKTGWPSFWLPYSVDSLGKNIDKSWFMTRIEVHCKRCGAHQGHAFNDGPPPTGWRYCINSLSLKFKAKGNSDAN